MARTPKNFDGIAPTGKRLSDLLSNALDGVAQRAGLQHEQIFAYWREIIGESMGPFTEPISWIDGVLTVRVKGSTLYSLLCRHERPRLLKRLQEKFPVRSVVFRIG